MRRRRNVSFGSGGTFLTKKEAAARKKRKRMVCKTNPSAGGVRFILEKVSRPGEYREETGRPRSEHPASKYQRSAENIWHYQDVLTGRFSGKVIARTKAEATKRMKAQIRRDYPVQFFRNPTAAGVKVEVEKTGKQSYNFYDYPSGQKLGSVRASTKQQALAKLEDDMGMMFGRYD
jgi:hypothetical protein